MLIGVFCGVGSSLDDINVLSNTVVFDNFNRANNNSSLGTANTGQSWQDLVGTWGVIDGAAGVTTGSDGQQLSVVLDSGLANCRISVKITKATNESRIVFRAVDKDNLFQVKSSGTAYVIRRFIAGSNTQIGSFNRVVADGDIITIELVDDTIKLYINGSLSLTIKDPNHITATKHGMGGYGVSTLDRYDDFKVEAI